jgi:hypothetical protein
MDTSAWLLESGKTVFFQASCGDLDAHIIESMNSVMDDNKMLDLASIERIPLQAHMRMIFEIRDLKHATPATVSRAGILYLSTDRGTQWRSIPTAHRKISYSHSSCPSSWSLGIDSKWKIDEAVFELSS